MNNTIKTQTKQSHPKRNEFVINSLDELNKIIKETDLLKRPRRTYFSLQLRYLSNDQREFFEQKLSKNYSACGCDSGAALGLISLIAYILIICIRNALHLHLIQILYSVIVFSIGAIIGKIFGLTKSNLRIKRIIRTLSELDTSNHKITT